jgi:tyrosyl-tRNA synthetase
MQINTDTNIIDKFLDHKIDQIYPTPEELRKRLESGDRLRFYIGADATGPNLHIGHLIPILKLKELQSMGHEIIFLVGDFTARLGDPTDKTETRKLLLKEEVEENSKEYQKQIAKYIDFEGSNNPAKIVFNSTWNNELSLSDVIQLASHTTVQQMLERDMFEDRINNKKPIFLHEFLYPLIQGYDSVALNVDGEFGGRDQTFNMLMGRTLMKAYKNKDKFVLTTHFLLSADGVNKMSKSIGNCIFINDSAETKYAKVMSIPDNLITHYYQLATNRTLEEIEQIENRLKSENDPMKIKKELAFEIVTIHDGEEGAKKADQFFTNTVQNNLAPESTNTFSVSNFTSDSPTLKDIITSTNAVESNAEAKRLIRANAVEINGSIETDINKQFERKNLQILRVGKKFWIKFID